jgi:protein O-mannosyl-transferase
MMRARKTSRSSSANTPRAPEARWDILLGGLLVLVTLLVYAQVWNFGFITVDDPVYVPQNPFVQAGITRQSLIWSVSAVHDCNWIPLTWLSLMLDTEIYGGWAGGYHLTNVLLHAASAVVLFLALKLATGRRLQSAFVAALFALHPLHVESVAWVAERKDVLSTLFGLLSLFTYLRYAKAGRRRAYVVSFLLFLCSLLSKQALVTLPFVFLLLDFWPLGRWAVSEKAARVAPSRRVDDPQRGQGVQSGLPLGKWRLVIEKAPFFLASAVFSAIAVATQSAGGAMAVRFPFVVRLGNAIVAYVAYLQKTVYPLDLAFYYPHPGARISWILVAGCAAILLAISAATVVWIRRYPFLFVGWFWYLGTLLPTIGLVQIGVQQMADRYTYFPLIGVFIAFAWLIPQLVPDGVLRTRVFPLTAVASLALLAATAFSQVSYWHDSVTLLQHSISCTPDSSHAHELLGGALIAEGQVSDGVDELQIAIKTAAPYAPLHYELAGGFERFGRLDDALREYRAALAIDERLPEAHSRIGAILTARGQIPEARQHLNRAVEIDPSCATAHANLAQLLLKTGDNSGAIDHAQRALGLNPELIVCYEYLGTAFRTQGRLDEAIDQFEKWVALSPDDQSAREELARTLALKRCG